MRTDEALTVYLPVDENREALTLTYLSMRIYLPVNENREALTLTYLSMRTEKP